VVLVLSDLDRRKLPRSGSLRSGDVFDRLAESFALVIAEPQTGSGTDTRESSSRFICSAYVPS